jgi:hypothetical protein
MLLAGVLAATAILVALAGGESLPLQSLEWPEKWHALAILVGCIFAALALERLGYRLTVAMLLAFVLWFIERKPPAVVALVTAGLSLGTFYLFSSLLKVPLPLGALGF